MTDAERGLVVAVDGPSGSGKSSAARGVAGRLGLRYLDTGAMYRAVTWAALDRGVDLADEPAVALLARELVLQISTTPGEPAVLVDGVDVTAAIREPRISARVSAVARNQAVRAELVRRQQEIARAGDIVVEGRDIATVVAPDADVKVLLTARPEVRLARRGAELGARSARPDDAALRDQVLRRDRDDSAVAVFHTPAPGAVVVDSSGLTPEQVVDRICALTAVLEHG